MFKLWINDLFWQFSNQGTLVVPPLIYRYYIRPVWERRTLKDIRVVKEILGDI